ncbi:MAG: hypothetical protein U1E13_06925 [Methylophilaceae bacterium]|nr:hypothetical protein [Methylophilaceae bacterium]
MTIVLRTLSLIAVFLAAVCFFMACMPLFLGVFKVRDILASLVFLILGVLAIRSAGWFWRIQRFWTDKRSLSEVSSLAAAILFWPLMAFFEVRTSGVLKDAVHIIFITGIVTVYIMVQLFPRDPRPTGR